SVVLRWRRRQSWIVSYYRVEGASSPFFVPSRKVIERDQLTVTQFEVRDLRPSVYFWRVRASAASGQTSDWSEPLKFIVTTQGNNGVEVPVANLSAVHLGGNVYIIRGISSPGVTLRVADREATAASDGSFQIQVSAPPSTREVTRSEERRVGKESR